MALRKLEAAGLVSTEAGMVTLHQEAFGAAARESSRRDPAEDFGVDAKRTAVLRNFVKDGRLLQIPMTGSKRRIVLEYLVTVFEPGVRYPEREVNTLLAVWNPDYAALRRYLVEARLMSRDAGVYWRSGGRVDVTAD